MTVDELRIYVDIAKELGVPALDAILVFIVAKFYFMVKSMDRNIAIKFKGLENWTENKITSIENSHHMYQLRVETDLASIRSTLDAWLETFRYKHIQ